MQDEAADPPTSAAPFLEAARKWLISTPWVSAQDAAGESTATTVLCELMELSRLWHLLYTVTVQCAVQQSAPYGTQSRSVSSFSAPTSSTPMTCTAVRQRFQRLLKHSNAYVQEFYRATRNTDAILPPTTGKPAGAAPAAQASCVCVADIDAADVFWALILYASAALCWRQQRFLTTQLRADAYAEDVVSSSQGTSVHHPVHPHTSSRSSRQESTHSSLSSTTDDLIDHTPRGAAARHEAASGAGTDSLSAALQSHYALGKVAAGDAPSSRCRSVLERLLPLLESHLSVVQLWRQPSLLAALDVLARGFIEAEDRVHASSSRDDTDNATRCPLCYAAALDNELAVEAFVHLRCYAAAYQGTEDADEDAVAQHGRQRRDGHDGAALSPCEVGWVAACRIALWNNCRASLKRLCCPPLFYSATWWPLHQGACERPGCGQQQQQQRRLEWRRHAVLEALWVSWWRAEVWLASCPSSSEITGTTAEIARDAAGRWRSALLFMQVVLPAVEVAARDPGVEDSGVDGGTTETHLNYQRANRGTLLAHLLRLPIVTRRTQPALQPRRDQNRENIHAADTYSGSVSGTVFHWLSQHGDAPLLTLLCYMLGGRVAAMAVDDALLGRPTTALSAVKAPAETPNGPHVVRLGAVHGKDEKVGDHRSHRAALPAPETAVKGAAALISRSVGQPASTRPARSLCSSVSSVWSLHLMDTLGRNALDVACRRQHLPCVRLLLQAGLSPNSLTTLVSDKCVDSLPLPLLKLLYDPSLLEGADSSGSTPPIGLAERLQQSTCPAAAASRTLAQLAFRLWTEKVRQVSMAPQAADDEGFALDQWLRAYARCQASQDRVLRPAMAALEFDAYEPTARLVMLSVLTRKLNDWLTTTPPSVRCSASNMPVGSTVSLQGAEPSSWSFSTPSQAQPAPPSLRQVRLQHTVALRLYTQLTCPLGRTLLRRAVDARCAVCDALAARGDRVAPVPISTSAIALTPSTADAASGGDEGTEIMKRRAAVNLTAASVPLVSVASSLALLEPVKSRQELRDFYERVLADAHALDARLVAEHQESISAVERSGGSKRHCRHSRTPPRHLHAYPDATTGVATVLRGLHHEPHTTFMRRAHRRDRGHDDGVSALYALAVIPSADVLQSARWVTSEESRNAQQQQSQQQSTAQRSTAGAHSVVEPTLWSFTSTPQHVWLRLPDGVDFDRLLRENGGGGFGVVADDMPPTAPVQRGDLVTFRCSCCGDGAGGLGDASARDAQQQKDLNAEERCRSPQFVVQQVFSERRTLPYLAWKSATAVDNDRQHQPPPASLVLPYAAASQRISIATNPPRDSITLHACCLPVSYVVRMTSAQLHNSHPLDWLLQTRHVATSSPRASESDLFDVLTTLQSSAEWTARWAQTVWAGYQPCWLEERMHPARDGSGTSQGPSDKVAGGAVALLGSVDSPRKCEKQPSSNNPNCCHGDNGRGAVRLTDPFFTWEDTGPADAHDRFLACDGRRSLRVRLTSTSCGAAPHETQRLSVEVDWPSRAEGCSAVATADVVVGSATVM
ncbi:conserved hypothetical protein [Leishmania braziliensis MHOM/BR/75/M2904]|uniref:Uncharacterized protein n=2 Tax=Leishmania braziliensis TaxID=5660 RepID=A4H5U8_LEIBR|nr:conserved hypothetical protein [Leishmania braziliensis MHOM/BR/75/M2904]CAJ2467582.1 unnamed protein product [Leishmania braziliensis]CAM41864.1 conserved hypothetical protein [Leishmania braziliensis MHOM/BR/75/M2904]